MIESPTAIAVIVVAGFVAGAINGVVGSGTLITFGSLVAIGVPPVLANGTNTTGLSFGGFSSAYAYRTELRDRWRDLRKPILATGVGAGCGALLVVRLPEEVFSAVVPWLIASATALVAVQPLRSRIRSRAPKQVRTTQTNTPVSRRLWPWTAAVGVYGGYFGAAQGIVLMAVLTWLYDTRVQFSNAAKNLLASVANIVAAGVFVISGFVLWPAALLLAIGAIAGGYLGARWARRLPEVVLRGMVVAVGILATVVLLID